MTKVTIIIPTYNRPRCLRRVLDFYSEYNIDYNIIIADSSLNKNKTLNKETVFSFPNLKILYLGDYPDKINGLHKFVDAIKYVKSKYCLFCGDDDFITPNGIKQSVDFLENNPDFTVAHGRYISFWLNLKKKREKQFCWQVRYSNQSITFSEPKKRLIKHLSEYGLPTFYGVHRTDFLKMIYRALLNSKISPQLFVELLLSMLTLIYGKMKCLDDVLYMARQIDSDHSYCNNWPTLPDFVNQGKYDEEYVKFKQCLAAHLSKNSQLSIEESKKIIDDTMSMYIKRYYSLDLKRVLINKIKYISDSLDTPDWIYKKIRLLYKKIFFPQQADDFFVSLDGSNPCFKYYNDFSKIRSHVISNKYV